jgi:hypothetical protein
VQRSLALLLGLLAATAGAAGLGAAEAERLAALAPGLSPVVLARALRALECAPATEIREARILAIIDYSLPSTTRRLWVFDRRHARLLFHELVAHGAGSGADTAERFSNRRGTRQSCLGLFLAGETYHGRNGYSLRLDGLDPGVNDHARARAIVIHGAWYVGPEYAEKHGRLGRSWGCPALDQRIARLVIDTLKGGNAIYVSAEDGELLRFEARRCGATETSDSGPAPGSGAAASRPERGRRCASRQSPRRTTIEPGNRRGVPDELSVQPSPLETAGASTVDCARTAGTQTHASHPCNRTS